MREHQKPALYFTAEVKELCLSGFDSGMKALYTATCISRLWLVPQRGDLHSAELIFALCICRNDHSSHYVSSDAYSRIYQIDALRVT